MTNSKLLIDIKDELISIHHAAWLSTLKHDSEEVAMVFNSLEAMLDTCLEGVPQKTYGSKHTSV